MDMNMDISGHEYEMDINVDMNIQFKLIMAFSQILMQRYVARLRNLSSVF